MMVRGLGCHEDRSDAVGSHSFHEILGLSNVLSVPAKLICELQFDGRFLDQQSTSSCVGHGFARAIQRAMRCGAYPDAELPSPLQIYDIARMLTGGRGIDDGTSIAAAAEQVYKVGFVRESVCPWNVDRVTNQLQLDEYFAGIDQRGIITHRLSCSDGCLLVNDIKVSLAAGKGVAIGMDVDDSFMAWDGSKPWDGMTSPRLGGHCMAVWDYPDGDPRLVNSYGSYWGSNGWFVATWQALANHVRSAWVVDVVPGYSR